jgi:hypothetical protein
MKSNFRQILLATRRKLAFFSATDCIFFLGVASVSYGLWQISPTATFIIVGGFFMLLTTWDKFK